MDIVEDWLKSAIDDLTELLESTGIRAIAVGAGLSSGETIVCMKNGIVTDEPTESMITYIKDSEKSGFEPGDRVRVSRVARDYESGWGNVWSPGMNEFVGKESIVVDIKRTWYGIDILCEELDDWYAFPWFVLEKIA